MKSFDLKVQEIIAIGGWIGIVIILIFIILIIFFFIAKKIYFAHRRNILFFKNYHILIKENVDLKKRISELEGK